MASISMYCSNTVHRKNLAEEKLVNLVHCEPFAKTLYSQYTENVFGICADISLFAKFFLTNIFYLHS